MPIVPLPVAVLSRVRLLLHRRAFRAPAAPLFAARSQRGQATTEYALVLLGAAAIALLLVAWATKTGAFASLLDAVMESIRRKV